MWQKEKVSIRKANNSKTNVTDFFTYEDEA